VSKLTAELEAAKREKTEIERQVSNNAGSVDKVKTMSEELAQVKASNTSLTAKLRELVSEKGAHGQSLADLEHEVKEHKSKRLHAKDELQKLLRQNDSLKATLQQFDETVKFEAIHKLENFRSSMQVRGASEAGGKRRGGGSMMTYKT
jgi:chromosome segregation ATPase